MKGKDIHSQLKRVLGFKKDAELAKFFSVSNAQISTYNNKDLTPRQIANYIKKAYELGRKEGEGIARGEYTKELDNIKNRTIRKIIEYSPIMQDSSGRGFINPPGTQIDYKSILKERKGVYIFYGSMYVPIYVGKTVKQDLWSEMKQAYEVKEVKSHHKICNSSKLKLKDVSHYVSAYEVREDLISAVEAIMIRSFINVVDNIKAERLPDLKE